MPEDTKHLGVSTGTTRSTMTNKSRKPTRGGTNQTMRRSRSRRTMNNGRRLGKNAKNRRPQIFILGRVANPVPLTKREKNIMMQHPSESKNMGTSIGDGASLTGIQDMGPWTGLDDMKKTPVKYLGLGELPPDVDFTEEELEKPITVQISESDTMEVFFKRSTLVNTSASNADELNLETERKLDHQERLNKHFEQADKYQFRQTETLNNITRCKNIQTETPETREIGCMTTTFDIFDTYNPPKEEAVQFIAGLETSNNSPGDSSSSGPTIRSGGGSGGGGNSDARSVASGASSSMMRGSSTAAGLRSAMQGSVALQDLSQFGLSQMGRGGGDGQHPYRGAGIGSSADEAQINPDVLQVRMLCCFENFRQAVETVERAVINNTMHVKQRKYRAKTDVLEEMMMAISDRQTVEKKDDNRSSTRKTKIKTDLKVNTEDNKEENSDNVATSNDDNDKVAAPSTKEEEEDKKAQFEDDGDDEETANLTSTNNLVEQTHSGIELLWCFNSEDTMGKNVSCMSWNIKNPDLLAVGYGSYEFGKREGGEILFWSMKNPLHPCKRIKTSDDVVSLDFSSTAPNLLAAGFRDGSVMIFDIREPGHEPVLKSTHIKGMKSKHSDAVWGVNWIQSGNTGGQSLTSISSDGSVLMWNMKKGLEPKEIMQLKRIPNPAVLQGSSKVDVISREAGALSVDFFNSKQQNLYIAGTEDGIVHKCSTLYSEQTLENYIGHTGPVYAVKCSPYSDLFLSCSADERIILWDHKSTKPILQIKKDKDAVQGLAWSPYDSCVFASISRDSCLKVWDLATSAINPVVSESVPTFKQETSPDITDLNSKAVSNAGSPEMSHAGSPDRPSSPLEEEKKVPPPNLTCVTFAPNSPVILVGGNDGVVRVYRLTGVEATTHDHAQQAERLLKTLGLNNDSQAFN